MVYPLISVCVDQLDKSISYQLWKIQILLYSHWRKVIFVLASKQSKVD